MNTQNYSKRASRVLHDRSYPLHLRTAGLVLGGSPREGGGLVVVETRGKTTRRERNLMTPRPLLMTLTR